MSLASTQLLLVTKLYDQMTDKWCQVKDKEKKCPRLGKRDLQIWHWENIIQIPDSYIGHFAIISVFTCQIN